MIRSRFPDVRLPAVKVGNEGLPPERDCDFKRLFDVLDLHVGAHDGHPCRSTSTLWIVADESSRGRALRELAMYDTEVERVMHEMPYGLYIVGSKEDGRQVNGMMADWVMQVSFEPRLVAVSFEGNSHTLAEHPRAAVLLREPAGPGRREHGAGARVRAAVQRREGAGPQGRRARRRCTTSSTACALPDDRERLPGARRGDGLVRVRVAEQFMPIGDHVLVVGAVLDGGSSGKPSR